MFHIVWVPCLCSADYKYVYNFDVYVRANGEDGGVKGPKKGGGKARSNFCYEFGWWAIW